MSASVKAGKAPDKYWRAQLAPLPPQGLRSTPGSCCGAPPAALGGRSQSTPGGQSAPLRERVPEAEAVVVGGEPAYPKCYFY